MIEAVGLAIIKGAVGKDRRKTSLVSVQNSAYAMHV